MFECEEKACFSRNKTSYTFWPKNNNVEKYIMNNTCLYCFSILLIIYKYHLRPGLNVAQHNPPKASCEQVYSTHNQCSFKKLNLIGLWMRSVHFGMMSITPVRCVVYTPTSLYIITYMYLYVHAIFITLKDETINTWVSLIYVWCTS